MPVCPHIETSQLIFTGNQLTGFYMRATLAFNGLKHAVRLLSSLKKQKNIPDLFVGLCN